MTIEYVRVKHPNGDTLSLPREHVDAFAGVDGGYEVLADVAAVDASGELLPPERASDLTRQYGDLKNADLVEEIDRRNASRGADDQIVPAGTTKADLAAALESDDATVGN